MMKLQVKDFVQDELGLQTIVLDAQPSNGMTIIEKFEQYANDATYAIIFFSPDDIVVGNNDEQRRARQNVILELGYFMGELGRAKECIL